jgi:hypothetical protein
VSVVQLPLLRRSAAVPPGRYRRATRQKRADQRAARQAPGFAQARVAEALQAARLVPRSPTCRTAPHLPTGSTLHVAQAQPGGTRASGVRLRHRNVQGRGQPTAHVGGALAKRAAAASGSGTPGRGAQVLAGVKECAGRAGGWLGRAAEADVQSERGAYKYGKDTLVGGGSGR